MANRKTGDNKLDFRKLLNKAFSKHTYYLSIHYIDEARTYTPKAEIPLETRPLELDDVDNYVKVRKGNEREDTIERMSKGDLCWCALCEGQIVGYVWRGKKDVYIPELKRKMTFPEDFYYAYEAYTHPDYRGKGVFKDLLGAWNIYAKENYQYKRAFAIIYPENEPAIRGALSAGTKIIGTITITIFCGVPFYNIQGKSEEDEELLKKIF